MSISNSYQLTSSAINSWLIIQDPCWQSIDDEWQHMNLSVQVKPKHVSMYFMNLNCRQGRKKWIVLTLYSKSQNLNLYFNVCPINSRVIALAQIIRENGLPLWVSGARSESNPCYICQFSYGEGQQDTNEQVDVEVEEENKIGSRCGFRTGPWPTFLEALNHPKRQFLINKRWRLLYWYESTTTTFVPDGH